MRKRISFQIEDLKKHLESLFLEGMSWNNYGEWHVDYKIPVSFSNIISYTCEDFKKCWSLDNLQLLWAKDNKDNKDKKNKLLFKIL